MNDAPTLTDELRLGRRALDGVAGVELLDEVSWNPEEQCWVLPLRLRADTGLPVHFVDERLTSYEAESTIAKSKRRDVRASGIIDSRAATIILQDFLNQRLPPPLEEPS